MENYLILESDPMKKIWRIPGFSNYEFVEGEGIYSLNYRNWKYRDRVKVHLDAWGYPTVRLISDNGIRKPVKVHVVAAQCYLGRRPHGYQVNHINGNKSDFSRTNLEYLTPSDNQKHAFRTGLHTHVGEKNPKAKLTIAEVKIIKEKLLSGEPILEIAKNYKVSRGLISHIKHGRVWAFV